MDKLLLHEGGHPLTLDDLTFLQSAIGDPLQALLSSLGDCIISGCEIHPYGSDRTDVTGGYIHYRGRIYTALPLQMPIAANAGELYYLLSTQEDGSRVYADGSEHQTKRHYIARLIWAKQAPEEPHIHMPSIRRIGRDLLRRQMLEWECSIPGALFTELTPNGGILEFPLPVGEYAFNTVIGTFDLRGANFNYGRALVIGEGVEGKRPYAVTLYNGALTLNPSGMQNVGDGSSLTLSLNAWVSIPISWAYSAKTIGNRLGGDGDSSYANANGYIGRDGMTGRR